MVGGPGSPQGWSPSRWVGGRGRGTVKPRAPRLLIAAPPPVPLSWEAAGQGSSSDYSSDLDPDSDYSSDYAARSDLFVGKNEAPSLVKRPRNGPRPPKPATDSPACGVDARHPTLTASHRIPKTHFGNVPGPFPNRCGPSRIRSKPRQQAGGKTLPKREAGLPSERVRAVPGESGAWSPSCLEPPPQWQRQPQEATIGSPGAGLHRHQQ